MNALTMLKAMSLLDPQDIADAWDGTEPVSEEETVVAAAPEPTVRTAVRPIRRIAELAAAAACIALGVTAVLKFSAYVSRPSLPSSPDQTSSVTAETTEKTALRTGSETQTTVSQTETQTEPEDTAFAVTASQTADTVPDPSVSSSGSSETAADTTQSETEALSQTVTERVALLAAMGDGAGQLTKNGVPCRDGEYTWSILTDRTEIEKYLAGTDPEVILGTGRKTAKTVSSIRSDPALIRVRWQSGGNRWESYGVTSAEERDGVLYLGIAQYCADAGGTYDSAMWVYEAGLLCRAAELPDLKDVQITVTEFSDTEETGIREWMRYNDTLDDDLYLTVTKIKEGQS